MEPRTGAERYLAERMENPEFREAFQRAQKRIAAIDELVNALDDERVRQGLSKAELARQAGLPPEAVRRLFVADHKNPTLMTVFALMEALRLELPVVPVPCRENRSGTGTTQERVQHLATA